MVEVQCSWKHKNVGLRAPLQSIHGGVEATDRMEQYRRRGQILAVGGSTFKLVPLTANSAGGGLTQGVAC